MPTLQQRLRELDRKVLREQDLTTPEGWLRTMRRWRWMLAGVGLLFALTCVNLATGDDRGVYTLIPLMVIGAFQAGATYAEHQRCTHPDRFMGRRRPDGL
jgi:hypothetical protein